jgi:hypothetical protein
MKEIAYEESDDSAILSSTADGEWIQSDSIVVLADWA